MLRVHCAVPEVRSSVRPHLHRVSATMAKGKRPVPSRTRKLSPSAPMVLRGGPRGRVGRRRTSFSMGTTSVVPIDVFRLSDVEGDGFGERGTLRKPALRPSRRPGRAQELVGSPGRRFAPTRPARGPLHRPPPQSPLPERPGRSPRRQRGDIPERPRDGRRIRGRPAP
jgi:hypothetical protein